MRRNRFEVVEQGKVDVEKENDNLLSKLPSKSLNSLRNH